MKTSSLLGRSPGPEFLTRVETLARSIPGVMGVHDLRAEYVGPETVHTGMHIDVGRELSVQEADRISRKVHTVVHEAVGCSYCVIHVDPADENRQEESPPEVSGGQVGASGFEPPGSASRTPH